MANTPLITLLPIGPADLSMDNVVSVYSGRNGKCCCGCAGKHTYAVAHRDAASRSVGYPIKDEDVNDHVVKGVINKIKRNADAAECYTDHVAVVVGARLYIAYLLC